MATKFDWLASESAPQGYPMEIVWGLFHYPKDIGLPVPSKKTIHHGWGEGVSTHVVGDDTKPIPVRLTLTFFSYTEDQFYDADFQLPYDKILELFQNQYYSPKISEETRYSRIIAGVAPGGHVSVWLAGFDKTTEVFAGQAKKIEGNWKNIIDNSDYSRKQFIKEEIEESTSTEERQSLQQHGVPLGLWETYRKRYHWLPIFTGLDAPSLIDRITFYNGEENYLTIPISGDDASHPLPIPKEMVFDWEWPKGRPLVFKLFFDEQEIFAAFNKLGSKNETLKLEMRMDKRADDKTYFSVLLKNENEEIFLKKTDLKNYGIPKKKE